MNPSCPTRGKEDDNATQDRCAQAGSSLAGYRPAHPRRAREPAHGRRALPGGLRLFRCPLRQHTHRRARAGARRSVRVPARRPDRGGDRQAGRGHRPRSRAAALLQGDLAGPAPRVRGPRGDGRRRPRVRPRGQGPVPTRLDEGRARGAVPCLRTPRPDAGGADGPEPVRAADHRLLGKLPRTGSGSSPKSSSSSRRACTSPRIRFLRLRLRPHRRRGRRHRRRQHSRARGLGPARPARDHRPADHARHPDPRALGPRRRARRPHHRRRHGDRTGELPRRATAPELRAGALPVLPAARPQPPGPGRTGPSRERARDADRRRSQVRAHPDRRGRDARRADHPHPRPGGRVHRGHEHALPRRPVLRRRLRRGACSRRWKRSWRCTPGC